MMNWSACLWPGSWLPMMRNQAVRNRAVVATVGPPTAIEMHADTGTAVFVRPALARQNGVSLLLSQIDSSRGFQQSGTCASVTLLAIVASFLFLR
jgi:hypothetical protein